MPAVRLLWIPVGACGHVVRRTSRWWELWHAAREHRAPRRLFHGVLEVEVDGARYVVEMAPAWGGPRAADRGVARTGPVGLAVLWRSRLFRYEVRCWRDGVLPDRRFAEGAPAVISTDTATARAVVENTRRVPTLTWGRAVGDTGDMWNSNSLVAWLLATSGIPTATLGPPDGGRAPGWIAGLAVALPDRRPSSDPTVGPVRYADRREPVIPDASPVTASPDRATSPRESARRWGFGVEWIVALVVFAVVSVVVIGVPMYLAMHTWSGRSDRRAAEARRRASSAHPTTATGGRTRRVLAP